ncbi:hypothetical protein H1R20_g6549, partial [Candolleomyces eurysporus]
MIRFSHPTRTSLHTEHSDGDKIDPRQDCTMPKEIRDIKQFIKITQRKDAKQARIKKDPLQGRRREDTDQVQKKAEKLKQSLPPAPGLNVVEVDKAAPKKK